MIGRGVTILALAVALLAGVGAPRTASAQAQRSAQSNCQEEAVRRGYVVLGTRNYEQHRDGWSLELQLRDAVGRVSWGSCFVETRTGDVSLYGFGSGGGGTGGNVLEFSCASVRDKYAECQLPVDGRAQMVKRQSDAPCIEGRSWGQRGDRVWVDDGCRARFRVIVGGGGSGGTGQHVDCRSEKDRYRECTIPRGYVGRLISDQSKGKCRSAGAWGTRDGLIWVNYGCKGRFELARAGSGGGAGGSGQQQRAEVQCRNQAAREGVAVHRVEPAQLRGSYWETTVEGARAGQRVRPICRYYPGSNRAELFYSGSGGPGWGSGSATGQSVAERACLAEAQRRGLRVYGQSAARPVSGGYVMQLEVRRGNTNVTAQCRYRTNSGRAEISY